MYHLNSAIPSPYELNQPQMPSQNFMQGQMPMSQGLARGGKPRNPKMIKVHMNSRESNILDNLQGGREDKDGLKSYSNLEHLLKNPHLVNSVHHHTRRRHAQGGNIPDQEAAQEGRHGDNEIVQIGPHTHHLFNQLATHHALNPHTEYPEYWSLGPALGGLWDTIKGVGREAIPALMPAAQQFLSNKFGGLGSFAGSMLPSLTNRALGPAPVTANPIHQAIGQGIGTGVNAYQNGATAKDAFGRGLTNTGQRFGNGFGETMQGMGNSLSSNQPWTAAAKSGLSRGFNNMGGMNGIANAAGNALNASNGSLNNSMNQYKQKFLPNPAQMNNRNMMEEMPFNGEQGYM